jgi:hypothetical protein
MEPGRWRKIDELFHAAAVCAGRERERILTLGCADDGVLRAEIESLLTAHERALSFIETPAFEASAHGAASATPTSRGRPTNRTVCPAWRDRPRRDGRGL